MDASILSRVSGQEACRPLGLTAGPTSEEENTEVGLGL